MGRDLQNPRDARTQRRTLGVAERVLKRRAIGPVRRVTPLGTVALPTAQMAQAPSLLAAVRAGWRMERPRIHKQKLYDLAFAGIALR